MADAPRDGNRIPTLIGVSSVDGTTPVTVYVDPTTHRLYVDASGGSNVLTTKGDLYTFTTVNARLGVGTDGQILSADSAQATGLKWITASGTGTVTSVSVVDANALTGSVANASTTPAITLSRKYRTIAGITTLANTDGVVKCTGTTYTVTLMSAATAGVQQVTIKNSASGNITIDGSGTETIDGSLTAVITPNTSLTLFSDGTNWFII